ncbi:hypothetical protein [Virgibacillus sp. LDC-1]|uniref:YphA family membrane protein n=1 Tax=Virgibacillus sp. LDC-1 TaxID=3039856 RepID=UPI0024DE9785|nr:hypothetical protein [Virgibacillus sp. LDC-1]
MDGLLFLWISWMLWVMVTFFIRRNQGRYKLSIWILTTIICSNIYVMIPSLDISLSFISLIVGGFVLFVMTNQRVYHFICSFTVMIGYVSFLIWEQQAPVWVLLPRDVLLPFFMLIMCTFIAHGLLSRTAIVLIGMCCGDLLYSLMLLQYSFERAVGTLIFLDSLFVVIFILFIIEGLRVCTSYVKVRIHHMKLPLQAKP